MQIVGMEEESCWKGAAARVAEVGSRGHIGWIVAGSLATGLAAALLLIAAPFIPATEAGVTGGLLCGFALGWAMLTVLSLRFTDQPQSWAL